MSCLSAIATQAARSPRTVGLRRAIAARHALLGDCTTFGDNARALLSRTYWRRPGCVVPLARRRAGEAVAMSAADLALGVARQALEAAPALQPARVGAVIYCHEAPDEKMSESTVGRLQYELGLAEANPLAISQAHNTSLWIALDYAMGLLHGPEQAEHVLLVASDKLVFGALDADARELVFDDVAAAVLLSREAACGWAVEAVQLAHFETPHDALSPWTPAAMDSFAAFGAAQVGQTLAAAGARAGGLHAVIAGTADARLAQRLHRAAGLPAAAAGASSRHASSAQPLLALAALEASTPSGQRVLAWGAGHNGEFACCVLTRL